MTKLLQNNFILKVSACENVFFYHFRMNHYFWGVPFNAPFDLSWGSRQLISFTYQKRCFMTIFRFRFFPPVNIFLWFFKRTVSRFGLRFARTKKKVVLFVISFLLTVRCFGLRSARFWKKHVFWFFKRLVSRFGLRSARFRKKRAFLIFEFYIN